MDRMLDSAEAARRLGVKLTTLYAYVSRGLLTSHRSADGRRSLFSLDEVERLSRRARGGRAVEAKLATVATAVTQLRDDGPSYRGRRAIDLVGSSFEEVAEWLWQADAAAAPWEPWPLPQPPALRRSDALRWAVVLAGAQDPLRSDLRAPSVVRAARRLIATVAGALPAARPTPSEFPSEGSPIAELMARRLSPAPTQPLIEALDASLVLLADHELATSTVAVRVAASARADLYDAVLAGLGTLGGPLHGAMSELVYGVLLQAQRDGVAAAVDTALRFHQSVPGFGHTVYRHTDSRFEALLPFVERLAPPDLRRLLSDLVRLAAEHDISVPNVDLALAALAVAAELPADAGAAIFSVARIAGWTAHYLEELGERPLRFRARAVYATAP